MSFCLRQVNPLLVLVTGICVIASCPVKHLSEKLPGRYREAAIRIWTPGSYVGSIILLGFSILSLSGGTYNPFIYFRF